MAMTALPVRPWRSLPCGPFASTPRWRPRHGPCRHTRHCLQDDGTTSFRLVGSLHLTRHDRRWLSSSGPGATRRPASSPTLGIVVAIPAWRGFTFYEDYFFPELTASKTAVLVERALLGIDMLVYLLQDRLEFAPLQPAVARLRRLFVNNRKGAAVVNREFLDWLSQRTQPERPFLAFLNYVDAHAPYRLPPGRLRRFGVDPTGTHRDVLIQYWRSVDKTRVSREDLASAADAYDDCIADLDEQLGSLYDELDERGLLERTWLVITSDHGESFGEHAGVFCHGSSLYQTELRVPLLIIPPGGSAPKQVVRETVSLRDVAATIVDVLGFKAGSPFPGSSLARFWNAKETAAKRARASSDPALAEVLPNDGSNRDSAGLPKKRWPLGAVIEEDWSYIRHEEEQREELFHLRADAKEQHNLAGDPAAVPTLERMRRRWTVSRSVRSCHNASIAKRLMPGRSRRQLQRHGCQEARKCRERRPGANRIQPLPPFDYPLPILGWGVGPPGEHGHVNGDGAVECGQGPDDHGKHSRTPANRAGSGAFHNRHPNH